MLTWLILYHDPAKISSHYVINKLFSNTNLYYVSVSNLYTLQYAAAFAHISFVCSEPGCQVGAPLLVRSPIHGAEALIIPILRF